MLLSAPQGLLVYNSNHYSTKENTKCRVEVYLTPPPSSLGAEIFGTPKASPRLLISPAPRGFSQAFSHSSFLPFNVGVGARHGPSTFTV